MVRHLGEERLVRTPGRRHALLHHDPAAQRHRHPAHGARIQQHGDGLTDSVPPYAGTRHPVAAGHRPCRHRHPDGGRAPARGRGQEPARSRPRRLHRAGLGLEGALRRQHHPAATTSGGLARLGPRTLHHGRRVVAGGDRGVHPPLRRWPDLPWQAPGQLGSGAAHRGLRPRGGEPGRERPPVAHALSTQRRQGFCRRRHHPPRDHARRHRRRRAPG